MHCRPHQVLLGNRYGYQPFPARIAVSEFETLRLIAEDAALPGAELLTDWFVKDDNVVPPEYILQVNSTGRFPNHFQTAACAK